MATYDYILEIDGIKGESQPLKDGIDISSWSLGLTNSGSMAQGGGGGTGKSTFHDMSFSKPADTASPALMKACATGQHIKTAKFHGFKAGGERKEYFTVTMTDLLVSSFSHGAANGDPHVLDSFSLNFTEIHFEYKPQDAQGNLGATAEVKYNIKEAKTK